MLKKSFFAGLLVAVVFHLSIMAPAFAGEEVTTPMSQRMKEWNIEVGGTADVYSKYIWRGQNLVDDAVFQPGGYVTIENFTASIWGNYTLEHRREWTELDYTVDYTKSLGCLSPELEIVSLSVGYIYYDFPNLSSNNDSQEVYAGIAVDTLLSPSFTVNHDFDEGNGTYYEGVVSHSQSLEALSLDKLFLNLSAAVGYNDDQWDFDSSFSSATFGASLSIPIAEKISLEPGVFYSAALDSQYDDEFYGGASLSVLLWD